MNKYLELNPQQLMAVQQISGPILILAGAGSGKTKTITTRICYMIEEMGIFPESILAITFTNKAAKEMKERVNQLLSTKKNLQISTFHSFCVKVLRNEIQYLGMRKQFTLYDTSDQLALIRDILKYYNSSKSFDRKIIQANISRLKNKFMSADDYINSREFDSESEYCHAINHCYREYQEKLKFYNAIDFDDILYLTTKLLKENPQLSEKYSNIYKYILVDEYQDTNDLQFELLKSLCSNHSNICVVGDDDQSIYSFRGANMANILNFKNIFKDTKIIKLEQNYRSTIPILNLANEVIAQNRNRMDKKMWSTYESTVMPQLWPCEDAEYEAELIVDKIKKLEKEGHNLNDIAVLYRSNNLSAPIEDNLKINGIDYKMIGGQKFYDKKEIKDILSYLSLIRNPFDEVALRRVINLPARGIGPKTLLPYIQWADQSNKSLFQALWTYRPTDISKIEKIDNFVHLYNKIKSFFKSMPLYRAIERLVEEIDFKTYIQSSYDNPNQVARRLEDIERFIQTSKKFSKNETSESDLNFFLEKMLLQDSQDGEDERIGPTLLTIHSSKGLEFETVFFVGLEEDIIPHKKSIEEGNVSEERRLCYVGMTRAKKNLYMTYCQNRTLHGKEKEKNISRFLIGTAKEFYSKIDHANFEHIEKEQVENYKNSFFKDLISSLED